MTSRLIAQMKADSSRAIAVATTFGRLPFRVSERKRPHNLICAFQAISRTTFGNRSWRSCSNFVFLNYIEVAPVQIVACKAMWTAFVGEKMAGPSADAEGRLVSGGPIKHVNLLGCGLAKRGREKVSGCLT